VRIRPQQNTKLEGLYGTKSGFFTQCEAEGFRRITYFLDRPDVMARYTNTIHAERDKYPVLLSNGNLVAAGIEESPSQASPASAEGDKVRHWVKFEDPFPKPCYLFAMVAAKLEMLEDWFVTRSGRKARLAIYVEPGKLDQCGFAMQCLKSAMKWDEEVFGLELDLDQYMIAAVGDFNSGAMENKGLNIFNTKYVSTTRTSTASLRTNTSTTGPATASPAATGSSSRSRKDSRCSATRNTAPTCTRARYSASRRCAACARCNFRRTPARWPIPSAPPPIWKSATSTP
jgi:aminopeptidase N